MPGVHWAWWLTVYLWFTGYPVEFFFQTDPQRASPLPGAVCVVSASGHTPLLRRGVTQIRYASLLATKWFIGRLGNRSSAGRQQTGRPSRRRRKRGRAIPVPASDHRKKGICRPLTAKCKYIVCFVCILIHSVLPAFCSSGCVRVGKARTRICATPSQSCVTRCFCSVSCANGGQHWRIFEKPD